MMAPMGNGAISAIVFGFGFVAIAEGLALALAPSRMEDALRLIAAMGRDRRRMLGLTCLALGVALCWLAKGLGA